MRESFRWWWLLVPLLTTLNQMAMKLLALAIGDVPFGPDWILAALHSPYLLMIVVCEVSSFVMWMNILAKVDVSKAVPLTGTAYVFILLLSWGVFHEFIMPLQFIGSMLILTGVWLIGTAEKDLKTCA